MGAVNAGALVVAYVRSGRPSAESVIATLDGLGVERAWIESQLKAVLVVFAGRVTTVTP